MLTSTKYKSDQQQIKKEQQIQKLNTILEKEQGMNEENNGKR